MIQLRPYQETGAAWLAARRRAYLADEPRVGKTPQALVAAGRLGAQRVAVLGPASARCVWPAMLAELEAGGYFPFGTPELRFHSYPGVVLAPRLLEELVAWRPQVLVLDEAHRLKNPAAMVTKRVLGTGKVRGIVRDAAPYVWALSGTPSPNHPGELFTVFARFWPEACQAHKVASTPQWERRFCDTFQPDPPHGYRIIRGVRNTALLRSLMFDAPGRFLRRTFEDVTGQLDPLEWQQAWVTADADEYARLQRDPDQQVATQLLRDAEAEEWPRQDEHVMRARRLLGSIKARHVGRLLREEHEDAPRAKTVVIAWHRGALDALEEELRGLPLVRVDGDTTPAQREARRRAFQDNPETAFFLGQLQAVKEGIDLSAADRMALVEGAWSPGDNLQVSRRLLNVGKRRPCVVTAYGLSGTYDEDHAALLVRKGRMEQAVWRA